ncbi:MAG: hypothetical protein KAS63_03810 [Candidatus Heimdallarchaeota archaeon]|nr:hypothetical protein [Candidatus Heimdallarchaeota archaeon]MCK4954459.1 hypothetical protein [Candidatus Heimdallarchaeota archaeon]
MYEVSQRTINWLMEENNFPVKYLTQTKLLDVNDKDPDVDSTKYKINTYKPIEDILKNQKENTYWFDKRKDKNYKKYLGSFWQIIFLYELHAQKNEQIKNGIEHIFLTGQSPSGGFSMTGTDRGAITCLTANIVRALVYFGYWKDERTESAVEYLLSKLEDKEGFICYPLTSLLKNCFMTIPKVLFALGSIPEKDRSPRIQKGIEFCVKYLLENQIFKYIPERNKEWIKHITDNKIKGQQLFNERSKYIEKYPNMKNIAKSGWIKFGFPLNYNSDALDAMRSLVSIDMKYTFEMESALELIKSKSKDGKWFKEKQYKSPMYTQIGDYQKTSKWITFHALSVIKHFEGLVIVE